MVGILAKMFISLMLNKKNAILKYRREELPDYKILSCLERLVHL